MIRDTLTAPDAVRASTTGDDDTEAPATSGTSGTSGAPPATRPGGRPAARPTTQPMRRPEALPVRQRITRAVVLVLLTLLVPGSAQLAAGNRRVGRIAVRIWLGLAAVVVVLAGLWFASPRAVLHLVTSPVMLSLIALFLFVVAFTWPVMVVDAWRLGRPALLPRRARLAMTGLLLVSVLATSLPVWATARRLWAAADLLDGVFGGGEASRAVEGRYNVLLLGGDAGADRSGVRPDSVTLASIDSTTGRTVLFSLPRNLENVRFPEGSPGARALPQGWTCGDECLLNGIYTWGTQHTSAFPGVRDPGAEAMKEAVEGVLGLKVNYYVLVDLQGFRRLIDAMGGIEVTVREKVPIGGGTSRVSGYIQPGTQHLDGYHALWYARSRHGANDYARMERQRCVMSAMVQQLDPATLLAKFQGIAAAAKDVMSTDIPASELATFIDLGAKGKRQKITSVAFVPPLLNPAYPDFGLVHDRVVQALIASRREATVPSASPTVATGPGAAASSANHTSSTGSTNGTNGTGSTGSTASSPVLGQAAAGGLSGAEVGSATLSPNARAAVPSPSSSAEAAKAPPVDVAAACAPA